MDPSVKTNPAEIQQNKSLSSIEHWQEILEPDLLHCRLLNLDQTVLNPMKITISIKDK